MKKMLLAGVALGIAMAFAAGAQAADKKTLAFVVNGASDFWKNAEAGIKKAQGELPDYNLTLKYPEQATTAAQQRLMDDLVASGVAAIMVSAVDPKTETEALNTVAGQIPLFTTDSDAPKTKRIAYIGSSNTAAGKQAGELALKALPDGGKCMGFVGLPAADNARERIEGVRETIKGSKVQLVDIRADDVDQARAKHNVEDAMTAHPEVTCFIGFYSYNTPRIYEAVKEAGQLGKIKIVGFDEDPVTLGGVKEGSIIGTVVQQPYEWGYQGMKLMAKYVGGDIAPTKGMIRIDGAESASLTVNEATAAGIAFVHQELNLFDNLDVAANVFIGRELLWGGPLKLVDRKATYRRVQPLLDRLNVDFRPDTLVSELSIAQQQLLEIAKALSFDARLVIMDEPTSSLTLTETSRLLEVVAALKTSRVSVIFISHRLNEIEQCADRVVVLRDGCTVGALDRRQIHHDAMIRLMIGRDLKSLYLPPAAPPGSSMLDIEAMRTSTYPADPVSL